jgi:hypothetical protein
LLKYSHPRLATILNYRPATVLLPTMLGLIAMLAVVTLHPVVPETRLTLDDRLLRR